ncbi:hypothetical protein MYA_2977 [Burkholderia sp. KJ006]|nr:hypothetical protein MYA_2977 [Burkholderia sp. KJ006]
MHRHPTGSPRYERNCSRRRTSVLLGRHVDAGLVDRRQGSRRWTVKYRHVGSWRPSVDRPFCGAERNGVGRGASLAGEPTGIGERCRGTRTRAAVDCCGRAIRALCAPNKKTAKRCAVAVSFLCPKHGR